MLSPILGLALLGMMDTDGAEAAFRTELERNPTNYIATLQLRVVARQDRRYDEARSLFERCLNMRPGDAAIRYQLATVELGAGKSSFYDAKCQSCHAPVTRVAASGGRSLKLCPVAKH